MRNAQDREVHRPAGHAARRGAAPAPAPGGCRGAAPAAPRHQPPAPPSSAPASRGRRRDLQRAADVSAPPAWLQLSLEQLAAAAASSSTGDAELARLGELGAGVAPGHDVARLLRDARRRPSRRARTSASCASSRVMPRERAGDDEGAPGERHPPPPRVAAACQATSHLYRASSVITSAVLVGGEEGRDLRPRPPDRHPAPAGSARSSRLISALERAEMARQRERGGLTHVADAEPVQQARQRRALALLDGRDEIRRGFLAHALEPASCCDGERDRDRPASAPARARPAARRACRPGPRCRARGGWRNAAAPPGAARGR